MTRLMSPARLAISVVAALAVAAPLVTGAAFGALQARIDNTQNTAGSGTSLYTHAYNSLTCTSNIAPIASAVSCPGSLYPANSASARADAITANGTVAAGRVTEKVAVTSCGAVQLANGTQNTANPQLPRYATSFGSTGPYGGATAITLDGSTSYAAAVAQQTEPGTTILGSSYGLGVWFKTNTTLGGPVVSFGSSTSNETSENFDRTLYMTTGGKLQFIYRSNGTATAATTGSFNTNQWYFAYVNISTSVLGTTITLYVDGNQVASAGGLFSGLDTLAGYWHLGWSPATHNVPQQYWAGSLADLAVFNASAPANPGKPASQAAYDTFAASATDYWKLSDNGITTTSVSPLPVIGTTAPCSYVDITWGFTNPTSCAIAPASTTSACTVTTTKLSAVGATAVTVGTVAPGTTQTSTITLAHDSSYTGTAGTFVAGLLVYAPIQISFTASTNWTTSFSWTGVASEFSL